LSVRVLEGDHPHLRWIGAHVKEALKDEEECFSGLQYCMIVLKDESHIFNGTLGNKERGME